MGRGPRALDALLVAAGCEHRIEGRGLVLAIYYVDGSSDEGQVLSEWLGAAAARALCTEAADLRSVFGTALSQPGSAILPLLRQSVADALQCPLIATNPMDPVIERVASLLEETLNSPPRVPDLARRVGLRQRELSARFRRETGLTIRRYVLWARLKAAVSALPEQGTLTEAAHAAGFADAAHLSRTFVQMFGVSPSVSVAASKIEVLIEA